MADANRNDEDNPLPPQGVAHDQGLQQQQGPDFTEIMRMFAVMILVQFVVQTVLAAFGIGQMDSESNPNESINITIPKQISESENYFDATAPAETRRVPAGVATGTSSTKKRFHTSLWERGTLMDLDLYITEYSTFNYHSINAENTRKTRHPILASWHEKNLVFDFHGSNQRNASVTFDISDRIKGNETILYAHIILKRRKPVQEGDINTRFNMAVSDEKKDVLKKTFPLARFQLRRKKRNEKNLLAGEALEEKNDDDQLTELDLLDNSVLGKAARDFDKDVILLYLKPVVALQLVNFYQPFGPGSFNADAMKLFDFFRYDSIDDEDVEERNTESGDSHDLSKPFGYAVTSIETGEPADYYPILHPSEFWMKDDSLIPVNGTLKNVTIELGLSSIQMWKFTLMAQMEQQWRMQEEMSPGSTDSDMFRSILLDTNPILLVVTAIVTVLHSVFDFLAFKNDIKFFKGKRSMEGLSVRSMVVNTFFQVVIFLYLMDNDTSKMVLISNGVGLLIEFWKISKAIKFSWEEGRLQWTETSTYSKSKTKEYDEIATSHLLFVTLPLVLGYGMYSLVHQKHKSWYSWILNTLVGFIYMFGFVMMTPQLFINYKLQSVAHLNWRTMTYKSVNTFIDDLFAFVVKMPIMHRLACLRDDVIFVVFLYQRYKYRTDYTRVNEFGQCEKPTEEMLKEAEEEDEKEAVSTSPSSAKDVLQEDIQNKSESTSLRRRSARERK